MSKIKKPQLKTGKIPISAITKQPDHPGFEYPVFSFLHVCRNHCLLSEWRGAELTELIDAFKTMESIKWAELGRHRGLKFSKVDKIHKPLPTDISPDVTIYEVRVSDRKRLFGYRIDNVFRLIWFDREHEVIPYRKERRK